TGDHAVRVVDARRVADRDLRVTVNRPGDFARYELELITSADVSVPPPGFDPQLAHVWFSFKVNCPDPFDCRADEECPSEPLRQPAINYLAKDYVSFRRAILDRLSMLTPGWEERTAADLGVTLAELLAYVGDYLSYRQDAVATEAYL